MHYLIRKAANILFASELTCRLKDTTVNILCIRVAYIQTSAAQLFPFELIYNPALLTQSTDVVSYIVFSYL